MELSFEQRLLRFLQREEAGERHSQNEQLAQPIDERVLEGECIRGARYLRNEGGEWLFECAECRAKFKSGDPVQVGDGHDFDDVVSMSFGGHDAVEGLLRLRADRYRKGAEVAFVPGADYVIDRRPLDPGNRLGDVVQAAFADERLRATLEGRLARSCDDGRRQRALASLEGRGLNEAQLQAGVAAIATEDFALVQGPPGTGKTKLLAEALAALLERGCRIGLCAFTHRALDNALGAIRKAAPTAPLFKLGNASTRDAAASDELRSLGVRSVDPQRGTLPQGGAVIAGTAFQFVKLPDSVRFHYVVFDEAGQLPIPHALAGMQRSGRWMFFGDHMQLPPVIKAEHRDVEASDSIFGCLHRHYGGLMLDQTYRMNEGVCQLVSDSYYGGRLRSAGEAVGRTMPFVPGGRLDEALDPQKPVVWLRVDHRQPGTRSHEEANAVGDLVADLVRQHGVPPKEIAVIAPFRAQVSLLGSVLDRKELPGRSQIVVDTVESIQGQEREVVILSLTAGDPEQVRGQGAFHLNERRLNVALSRARTKAVLVASAHTFEAVPMDLEALRAASRCRELRDRMAMVDVTRLYCGG